MEVKNNRQNVNQECDRLRLGRLSPIIICLAILTAFLAISLLLTFKVINLPSPVIGDNFYWTSQNVLDILGPRTIRQTYLGDTAIVSSFKSGFLFPIAYVLSTLKLPLSIVYPFLFYFLSMISFYSLTKEFLHNRLLRMLASSLYIINPVTVYYFESLLNAFSLVFLPLALKFFIKSLRDIDSLPKSRFLKNFTLTAILLSLSVSAQEQFFLSFAFFAGFLILTFVIFWIQKYGLTLRSMKNWLGNIAAFAASLMLVNIPLAISIINLQSAPLSTYFTGRFYDFLASITYTYSTADPVTLLRFGGDAGAGLGKAAWYDSNLLTNLFGYALFVIFVASVYLIVKNKKRIAKPEKAFFFMSILIFFSTLITVMIIRSLPENLDFARSIFSFPLQTWESPAKLRILLLLSALATSLVFFQKLENFSAPKRKIYTGIVLVSLVFTTIAYNSPWLINYAGSTPMQEIADNTQWGDLYDQKYADMSNFLAKEYPDERGLIIPYTHKVELYAPPNFRLFQLVSNINEEVTKLTQAKSVQWSKLLALLSAKYIALQKNFEEEYLIFPKTADKNITKALDEIRNSNDFKTIKTVEDYAILENQNALPQLYATNFFVFYDNINTLNHAIQLVDFKKLPAFLTFEARPDGLGIPSFVDEGNYEIAALSLPIDNPASNVTITLENNGEERSITLSKTKSAGDLLVFSAIEKLEPGDTIRDPNLKKWRTQKHIDELVLNSSSYELGSYGSFTINFTTRILLNGKSSFLSPRVSLDTGEKTYVLIFHDNGFVELATSQNGIFTSALTSNYIGYRLKNQNDYIDVSISRVQNFIQVYINEQPVISFSIESKPTTVSLSSEQSISKFENINLKSGSILSFFATRQVLDSPTFEVQYLSPEKASLTVSNNKTKSIVVSQYLNTRLSRIATNVPTTEAQVNLFFKAWIVDMKNSDSAEIMIKIETERSQITMSLTLFSIFATYFILIISVLPFKRKFLIKIKRGYDRLRRMNKQEEKMHAQPNNT